MSRVRCYKLCGKLFGLWALLCLAELVGCAADNRVGAAAADALAQGAVRTYALGAAASAASACLSVEKALVKVPVDLGAAQAAWVQARLAYDRGAAFYRVATPALDEAIDGTLDNPFSVSGMRQLERPLFAMPAASDEELARLGSGLARSAVALPGAVRDASGPTANALLGSMAALAAQISTKLDGSDSPFAGQSHLSIENNLIGLSAMYGTLSPLVERADANLDARIQMLLSSLRGQIAGVANVDAVADKLSFLRAATDLSQSLFQVGVALGLSVTAPVDVT